MPRFLSLLMTLFCTTTALWAAFTPAAFTVYEGKQVAFTQGNLQCSGVTTGNYTWSFAENQYDIIGTANVTGGTESYDATYGYSKDGSALADKIDLFGWSGSTGSAKWGISTSSDDSDYSGDFVDWGKNIGDDNTYRTLTKDEWAYLLNTRPNANNLKGVARINLNSDGTQYANGLILLPDSWADLTDVTFNSGFASSYGIEYYATYQTFTLNEWQQLEAAGAVFLPASGSRNGSSNMRTVQYYGSYWSATAYGSNCACLMCFGSGGAYAGINYRNYGRSVRLVQDYEQYAITITPPEHGSIAANKTEAVAGETITLTITPDTCYELDVLTVKDAANNDIAVTNNTFTMPASAVTVSATFKLQTQPTAIGNTFGTADTTVRKVLRNGQVLILRNDKTYTLTGVEVQ